MNADDKIRLQHMLDAAQEAQQLAAGKTRQDLDNDRVLSLALIHELVIIGEAAARVSQEVRL